MTLVTNVTELNLALTLALPGDDIDCAPGLYDGVSGDGKAYGGVTVQSQDPSNPAVFAPFYLNGSSGITFLNLIYDQMGSVDSFPFRIISCDTVSVLHCGIHGDITADPAASSTGLLIEDSTNILVQYNEIYKVGAGIETLRNDTIDILNNYIHDFAVDGVINDGNQNITINDNWGENAFTPPGPHPDFIQFFTTAGITGPLVNTTVNNNLFNRGTGNAIQGITLGDEAGLGYTTINFGGNIIIGATTNGLGAGAGDGVTFDTDQVLQWSDQDSVIVLRGGVTNATVTNCVASAFDYLDGIIPIESGNTTMGSQPADQGAAAIATWQAAHSGIVYGPTGITPSWVPRAPSGDLAVVYANFATGQYWDGSNVVTVDGVVYGDPNWGPWDPSIIVPGSGVPTDNGDISNAAIIQALIAGVLGSLPVTIVVKASVLDNTLGGNLVDCEVYDTATFSFDAFAITNFDVSRPGNIILEISPPNEDDFQTGPSTPLGTLVIVAFNTYDNSIVASMNGALNLIDTGTVPSVPPDSIVVSPEGPIGAGFLISIAIYASQPDSDLPILSGGTPPPPSGPSSIYGNFDSMIFARVSFGR